MVRAAFIQGHTPSWFCPWQPSTHLQKNAANTSYHSQEDDILNSGRLYWSLTKSNSNSVELYLPILIDSHLLPLIQPSPKSATYQVLWNPPYLSSKYWNNPLFTFLFHHLRHKTQIPSISVSILSGDIKWYTLRTQKFYGFVCKTELFDLNAYSTQYFKWPYSFTVCEKTKFIPLLSIVTLSSEVRTPPRDFGG